MRRGVSPWLPFWPTERLRRLDLALPPDGQLITRSHDGRCRVIAAACPTARTLGLTAACGRRHVLVPGGFV